VLGPGEPPVPFAVPLLDIEPAAALPEPVPPPEAPPEPPPPACAKAEVLVKTSAATKRNLEDLILNSYAARNKRPSSIPFQMEVAPEQQGAESYYLGEHDRILQPAQGAMHFRRAAR